MEIELAFQKTIRVIVLAVFLTIVAFVGSCQGTNYQVRKMVESGAHPVMAACAISDKRCSDLTIIELEKLRK